MAYPVIHRHHGSLDFPASDGTSRVPGTLWITRKPLEAPCLRDLPWKTEEILFFSVIHRKKDKLWKKHNDFVQNLCFPPDKNNYIVLSGECKRANQDPCVPAQGF